MVREMQSTLGYNPVLLFKEQGTENKQYAVEKHEEPCNYKVRFRFCHICPHNYSYDCLDALLHATVCKHIHLAHMKTTGNKPQNNLKMISSCAYKHNFSKICSLNLVSMWYVWMRHMAQICMIFNYNHYNSYG